MKELGALRDYEGAEECPEMMDTLFDGSKDFAGDIQNIRRSSPANLNNASFYLVKANKAASRQIMNRR